MYKCSGLSSPENLTITERRDTSVSLKWDESTGMADISYYEVTYTDVSLCTLTRDINISLVTQFHFKFVGRLIVYNFLLYFIDLLKAVTDSNILWIHSK